MDRSHLEFARKTYSKSLLRHPQRERKWRVALRFFVLYWELVHPGLKMLVQMLVLHTTAQVHVREILKSKESKKLSQVPAEDEPRRIVWMGLGKKTQHVIRTFAVDKFTTPIEK